MDHIKSFLRSYIPPIHCKGKSNDHYHEDNDQDLLGMTPEEVNDTMKVRDNLIQEGKLKEFSNSSSHKLSDEEIEEYIKNVISNRKPIDRIKEFFSLHSGEETITHGDILAYYPIGCFLISGSLFAPLAARHYSSEYRKKNQLTSFTSQYMAQRKMIDYTIVHSMKNGASLGARYTVLSTIAYFVQAITETYLGRSSFWQYGLASGIATGLYCINRGPRGIFAGTTIGLFFGLVIGTPLHFVRGQFSVNFEDWEQELLRSKLHKRRNIAKGLSNVS